MTASATRQISRAFSREDWPAARAALELELASDPSSHWLLTCLAMTYYEVHDYDSALQFSQRARQIAPGCPLVRWDRACILDMLKRPQEAITEWKSLLKAGVSAVAHNECGESEEWARSLLNDCRYRIALANIDANEFRSAARYLRNYLSGRDAGIASIFDRREAKKKLAICLTGSRSLLT